MKKIYLRSGGGGDSAAALSSNSKLVSVEALPVDDSVYSKYHSVSIDSGTTATYLSHGLSPAFKEVWKKLAGTEYHHDPMILTEKELNNLPTILLQFDGNIELNSAQYPDPSKVPGLAGDLDPHNRYDIIVAIPPSHYMEHVASESFYHFEARFYVDEYGYSAIIGANTMMGHDILFDVEEGALGFAESHCDYTQLEEEVGKTKVNHGDENDVETSTKKSGGYDSFALVTVFVLSSIGYVAYHRLGGREMLANRHGRLSTFEDAGDLQLRPIA